MRVKQLSKHICENVVQTFVWAFSSICFQPRIMRAFYVYEYFIIDGMVSFFKSEFANCNIINIFNKVYVMI